MTHRYFIPANRILKDAALSRLARAVPDATRDRARGEEEKYRRRIAYWLQPAEMGSYRCNITPVTAIAAVDRAALEVAMQINTGSIERDCPESLGEREARDRHAGPKERRRDEGRGMREEEGRTEREKPEDFGARERRRESER